MAKYFHSLADLGRLQVVRGYNTDLDANAFLNVQKDETRLLQWLTAASISEMSAMRREIREMLIAIRELPKQIATEIATREAKVARAAKAAEEKAERDLVKTKATAVKEIHNAAERASKARLAEIRALDKLPPAPVTVIHMPDATIDKLAEEGLITRKF